MSDIAVICSGQGAQSAELLSSLPFTQRGNSIRDQVLQECTLTDPELRKWLKKPESAPERCFQNRYAQPFICLYHAMVWAELVPLLSGSTLITGYSLGELSACHCASFFDAVTLVSLAEARARCMDEATPFSGNCMIAVTGIREDAIKEICNRFSAHIAIVLSETHWVLGCHATQTEAIAQALRQENMGEIRILDVGIPSHTPFLTSATQAFRERLSQVPMSRPRCVLLSACDASRLFSREQILEKVPAQISQPLRWDLVMARIQSSAPKAVLEIGPGTQLSKTLLREHPYIEVRAISEFRSFDGVLKWIESRRGL